MLEQTTVAEMTVLATKQLNIGYARTCECTGTRLNCLTAKEWPKAQLGVWQFSYEGRDVRDKSLHPATFPISLAARLIALFTHQGELVLDPCSQFVADARAALGRA